MHPLRRGAGIVTARYWLALAAGVAAISWAAPLIRMAEAPALMIAALRLALAAPPAIGAAAWRRRDELRAISGADAAILVLAGVALAGHFAFWVASVQRTSVVTSVVLVTTQPLFVAAGGWLLLRERPARSTVAAIGIASVGALVLAAGDLRDPGSLVGDLFAVAGAVLASVYLLAGRRARARLSNLSFVAVVNGVAAAILLGMLGGAVLAGTVELRGHPQQAFLYIALLALVPQLIGHGALTWALGALPAVVVAVAILGEPVGAVAITATLLDETPTLPEWLGSALVLLGVYVALRGARTVDSAPATL